MTIDFLYGLFFLTTISSACFLMLEASNVLDVTKNLPKFVLKMIRGASLAVLIALFGYMFGTSYLYSIQHAGEISYIVHALGGLCLVFALIGLITHSKHFRKAPEA